MTAIVKISVKNGIAIVDEIPAGTEVFIDEQDAGEKVRYWAESNGEIYCDVLDETTVPVKED